MTQQQPPPVTTPIAPEDGPRYTLRERIVLTYRHHGLGSILYRIITFPLRFTPLQSRLQHRLQGSRRDRAVRAARSWYRREGRPVTIVIPSYRDAAEVADLVASLRRTTDVATRADHRGRRCVSGPSTSRRCAGSRDRVVAGETNAGFAANVNRGIAAAGADSTTSWSSTPTWSPSPAGSRACSMRHLAARRTSASSARKLLYQTDGSSSPARSAISVLRSGSITAIASGRPDSDPPTCPAGARGQRRLHVHHPRSAGSRSALFDEALPDGLRGRRPLPTRLGGRHVARSTGRRPSCSHLESVTRGTDVGERERASQRVFWQRWGEFFDARNVRTPERRPAGRLRDRGHGIGGGHRDIFEHLNWPRRTRTRSRAVDARRPSRTGSSCTRRCAASRLRGARRGAGAASKAIKVATWWNTSRAGLGGQRAHGHPGLLRPGHRDELLPDQPDGPGRRPGLLPARVPLHDDLVLEPRPAARARSRRGAHPAGHRPRQLPPAARGASPRRHAPGPGPDQPAQEPAADPRGLAAAARAAPRAVPVRDRARGGRPSRASATSPLPPTPRSTSSSTRPPCSSRPRCTRASACRRWSRWPPAAPWSAPTPTATATSAPTARTA